MGGCRGWDKYTSSASLEKQRRASASIKRQVLLGGAPGDGVPGRACGSLPRDLQAQVSSASTMDSYRVCRAITKGLAAVCVIAPGYRPECPDFVEMGERPPLLLEIWFDFPHQGADKTWFPLRDGGAAFVCLVLCPGREAGACG